MNDLLAEFQEELSGSPQGTQLRNSELQRLRVSDCRVVGFAASGFGVHEFSAVELGVSGFA